VTSNESKTSKTFENPIFISMGVLWSCGVLTLVASSYFLPKTYTGFDYSVGVEGVGFIIFLMLTVSILTTTSVWSFLTFKYRVVEYAEKFDKEIEQERLRSLHTAKLSALGRMAAGVAHEINNPLAIIAGSTHMLQKQTSRHLSQEEIINSVSIIDRQVIRISNIVKALRSITGDGSRESKQLVSLQMIILQAHEFLASRLKSENIEFIFNDQENEIKVFCRATEISQIIYNLFSNSIDALEGQKDKWIRVSVETVEGYCFIKFSDSGGPLDKDLIEKVMEPFFTTKDVGKGTGLGLSICSSIAKGHGGLLEYDTTAPTTTFILKLPIGT